jgi:hypothetical protein
LGLLLFLLLAILELQTRRKRRRAKMSFVAAIVVECINVVMLL